jgi:hypothetical protein
METTLLQQLLNIAQRERIAKTPPDGTKDETGFGLPPFENRGSGSHFAILSRQQPATLKVATHPKQVFPSDFVQVGLPDEVSEVGKDIAIYLLHFGRTQASPSEERHHGVGQPYSVSRVLNFDPHGLRCEDAFAPQLGGDGVVEVLANMLPGSSPVRHGIAEVIHALGVVFGRVVHYAPQGA